MRRLGFLLTLCAVALLSTGAGGSPPGGSASVLGVWGGNELESFRAVVRPFENRTGVRVRFEGTRDINAVLTTRVRGGNPPDLAVLPTPGRMREFVRESRLVPLDAALDLPAMRAQYAQRWLELGSVSGKVYGVFVKVALKGLVWHNPRALRSAGASLPGTWNGLMALTDRLAAAGKTPWCIGLESGAASGWPATDWIEILMLRSAPGAVYDRWSRHEIPWTHPAVKRAWSWFGKIAATPSNVHGGIEGELATNFGEAPFPLFAHPAGCYFHLQGSFIQDFILKQYPGLVPGADISFAPFPPADRAIPEAVEVSGDVMMMFRDTPPARALVRYLVTPEAQAIWVGRGSALSANRRLNLATYPDSLSRKAAAILAAAPLVHYDASDLMPDAINSAFLQATLEYVQHPDRLDLILNGLERVSAEPGRR